MLNWAKQFSIFLFFDSNEYPSLYGRYECLLGVNPVSVISCNPNELFQLANWHQENRDWLLGHICYDYKNILEPKLTSGHEANTGFPLFHFFCPQVVCYISSDKTTLTIESVDIYPDEVFEEIRKTQAIQDRPSPSLSFTQRLDQEDYLRKIERLREHIKDGDCYEVNFCNEGFCDDADIDPLAAFKKLNEISAAPFAAFYKLDELFMMCASPERYLLKDGNKLVTQPIKGTAKRDRDSVKDEQKKVELFNSIKDRAENVMIVDLVRNDLARSCEVGSVYVDELFGIYSFPQVHQLISTVSGSLKKSSLLTDAIVFSFPMGSMTGAPKVKVMELIEKHEMSRRELFSGTVGYINPDGDFDFNVVIRSLFYNASTKYLSYHTGGAITYDSDPINEWEEMRLKAWALEQIFSK